MSLLGVAVSALLFARRHARRSAPRRRAPAEARRPTRAAARSSRERRRGARDRPPHVPIEVLLLQIERHVRLEQAAAESFLDAADRRVAAQPRRTSPLVH